MSELLFLTGIASSLCGLACLYLAWKSAPKPMMIILGWLALVASGILMFIANGDRGTAQGLTIWMMVVSVMLCLPLLRGMRNIHDDTRRKVRTATERPEGNGFIQALNNVWTFLLTGPVAGVIAIFFSAALFRVIRPAEGNPATAAVSTIIMAVFLWAVVSVLLLIEPRPIRRTLYAGVSVLTATALAFI